MNPDSLCAKCRHLEYSTFTNSHFCKKRNCVNRYYKVVFLIKGYTTCVNFKPKEQQ